MDKKKQVLFAIAMPFALLVGLLAANVGSQSNPFSFV